MKRVPPIYQWLANEPNLAAGKALATALPGLEVGLGAVASDSLFQRQDEAGLAQLVAEYHLLPEAVRRRCLDAIDPFFGVLGRTVKHTSAVVRTNAVRLVGDSRDARLAYLLAVALHDGQPKIRSAAAACLRETCEHVLGEREAFRAALDAVDWADPEQAAAVSTRAAAGSEQLRYLVSAVGQALGAFDQHHRTEVIEAAAWYFEHLESRFQACAAAARSKAMRAAAEVFQASVSPRMASFAYRALKYPELRPAVVRKLSICHDDAFMLGVVDEAWITGDSAIRRLLHGVRSLAWLEEGIDPIVSWPVDRVAKAVRLVRATGVPADRQVELFRQMVLAGPPAAQRAGLWALVELDTPGSTRTLQTVLDWDDNVLSPIALWELMRRSPRDLHGRLVRRVQDRGGQLDRAGQETPPSVSFERSWGGFDRLTDRQRATFGHVLRTTVPDLVEALRQRMRSASASDRLRALSIGRDLELTSQLDEDVYRLARDPDATVRAGAVAALAHLAGPTAERIARQALEDPDGRVQANAVEVLDALQVGDRISRLQEKLRDRNNRVRANAIKALLRLRAREAAEALLEMLQEPDRAHRTSALWLIEKLELVSLRERVEQVACSDPDARIRRRARRLLARFGRVEGQPEVPDPVAREGVAR